MSDTDSSSWVLPAGIPFAELKARDLEECVHWLLDAMGARDLEWRTGGAGGGAADGGRDLEATFYVPSPDGEMDAQRWWIECKGRKGTVEPDEVKSAVNNATAHGDLAYLVVVTNTTFSNPTRDWIRNWQASHPRPRVRLWDHETLERLLSKHPSVVLRLFSEALSPAGLLKAAQERFWSKLEYTPVKALRTFWSARGNMEIDALERFALIANEFAHGSIADRPWAASTTPTELIQTTHLAFTNLPYLRMRIAKVGVDEEPILAALAHLIVASLQVTSGDQLAALILEAAGSRDGKSFPDEVIEVLLMPVLDRLAGEMQDVCTADCDRLLGSEATTLIGPKHPVETYWRGVGAAGASAEPDERRYLRLERHDGPCKVGFALNKERGCPLYELKPVLPNVAAFLNVIERVSEFRLAEARQKAVAEAAERRSRAGVAGSGGAPA